MAAKIDIVVEAVDKASKELGKVNDQLEDITSNQKKQDQSFRDSGIAIESWASIVERGWEVLKQLYSTAREGAALDYAAVRFDRLAESIDSCNRLSPTADA